MSEQEFEPGGDEEIVDAPEVEDHAEAIDTDEVEIETPPAREWSNDDEAEARAFGWKPKAEWQGRVPEGFIEDPRAYMDRAMTFKPFRTLKERQDQIERDYQDRLRKLETVSDRALQTQRAQFQAELSRIQDQKRQAVEMADTKAYETLERQEKAIQQQMYAPQQQPQIDPVEQRKITEYRSSPDGEWMGNAQMVDIGRKLIDGNPDVLRQPHMEQIKWAERELKRLYPHYFTAGQPDPAPEPKPAPRQTVDPGGLAGGRTSDGFTKLPREAKEAFKRFVSQGLFSDDAKGREEYAREYNAA